MSALTDRPPRHVPASNAHVDPRPGQLVRRRLLGTDATYRVVGPNDRGVEVEVVEVPGLSPGGRFTFASEDVRKMDAVPDGADPHAHDEAPNIARVRRVKAH